MSDESRAQPSVTAESEDARFRRLVESVVDYAIYMLDPTGVVTTWNAGAERFKGYTAREIIGKHFSLFYTEEDRATDLPRRALEIAAKEGRFEREGWRVRKDGTQMWAHVVIDPIRGERGEIVGFAKVTRDITEKHQAQQTLEETRAAFVQAQKVEAIGQLTGGIAHDFNNLLSVIMGNLELAQKRMRDEDARLGPLLENSLQAARRGAALTQRMLAFARRQELRSEAVDLPSLVRGMADLLRRSIGPTISIETQFTLGLPPVLADPNQLELCLLNLAVNARDAMADGGKIMVSGSFATILTDEAHGLKAGDYITLSVKDSGTGMDQQTLSHAIEPFFTTKGVGRGTGLGLSMVDGFAEQAGGKLVLASEAGKGTTATIWLPVAETEQAKEQEKSEDTPGLVVRPLTVLAVDDDSLVLMNTAAMLEDLGHRVIEAMSGQAALDIMMTRDDIDLVVTDQAMPGMTGAQLAARIRSQRPTLPIIVATGYAELPAGFDQALVKLTKPFPQSAIADAIAAIFATPP